MIYINLSAYLMVIVIVHGNWKLWIKLLQIPYKSADR